MTRLLVAALSAGVACSNASSSTAPIACVGGVDASIVTNIGSTASAAGDCNLPNVKWGTVGAGGACQNDGDCQPTCCACPSSTKSAMVSWCNDGTCADANDTCCGFAAIESSPSLVCP